MVCFGHVVVQTCIRVITVVVVAAAVVVVVVVVVVVTPWGRSLLEKLTVSQLVKKFPAFYGTRKFITAVTRARHLSLS
jgi:hypothetical protein